MAGKANGKAAAGKSPKKEKAQAPKKGHNKVALAKAVKRYFADYNDILDKKESMNGDLMRKAKEVLEKAANETGMARKLLRKALSEKRALLKLRADEKSYEPDEKKNLNDLRGCLDLPLFRAADTREEAEDDEDEGDEDNLDLDDGEKTGEPAHYDR